jgi:DNA-binding NarL/FixJ family response regulator
MIRILLVDDQALFREALCTLLAVQADFDVVAQANNGEEAIRLAALHKPDIVLMDLKMPVMDGVVATQRIRSALPDVKVIVLTTFDDDTSVYEGLRAGAIGYLLKDASPEKLYEAIRSAYRGEYFLLPQITAKVVAGLSKIPQPSQIWDAGDFTPLSQREIEILEWVARGLSNREIAERLVIAEGTVKNHMRNILGKLNVKDRMQAVFKGKELGLIP